MKNVMESVNLILAEWDPLNVGENIAIDEYRGYVPLIIKHITSKTELIACLEDVLINKLEAGYNPNDEKQKIDLEQIVDKIMMVG
ncbi:hypothetical protein ACTHGU_09470 [Chitinophagaceae bacterium MMS25-I14]